MEKLHFKMLSNNKEIINENISYYKKDNIINFKINDDLYNLDLENIILTKKDKEKELVINFKDRDILITVLTDDIKVRYPIASSSIKKTEKGFKLDYLLDEGEKLNNCIIIEF